MNATADMNVTSSNLTESTGAVTEEEGFSGKTIFVMVTSIAIAITGVIGNSLTVFVIIATKNLRQRLANLFIVNQCLIDFISCLLLLITVIPMRLVDTYEGLKGWIVCCLWSSNAFMWGLVFSSTYSLMALTIERYLSVVYPVWHKIFFLKSRGFFIMALTWIAGLTEGLAHSIPTSIIINGVCYNFYNWPSPGVQKMAGVITVTLHYILPICILMYCYGRMILVISGRIVKINPGRSSNEAQVELVEGPTTSNDQNHLKVDKHHLSVSPVPAKSGSTSRNSSEEPNRGGVYTGPHVEDQESNNVEQKSGIEERKGGASAEGSAPKHTQKGSTWTKAKKNVIYTLAIVSLFFAICWTTNQIYYLMMTLGYPPDFSSTFYHVTVMGIHLNACVNPFIYLFRYEQFKRATLKLIGCDKDTTLSEETKSRRNHHDVPQSVVQTTA